MEQVKHRFSAGGVVVNAQTGDILVVNQHHNSWSLPKGHIETEEDSLTAAKREICEESGISELTLVKDLGSYTRPRIGKSVKIDDVSEIKHIHMYLFTTSEQSLHPTDPRNPEARWIERDTVANMLTHKRDKEFFNSIIKELPDV